MLRSKLQSLQSQFDLVRHKLDLLIRQKFGSKSERMDPNQLELLLSGLAEPKKEESPQEDEEPDPDRPKKQPRKRRPRGIRHPDDLEVVEELILPDLVREQPDLYKEISREMLEQLDYEPGRFFKRRVIRPKFVRRDQRQLPPLIAPAPPSLMPRGLAGTGLLTEIIIAHFCDHQPFYRLEQAFRTRHGVDIPRGLMAGWTQSCADWLEGIHEAMRRQLRQSSYIQVDETTATYLDREHPKGKGKGHFWVFLKPGEMVAFNWGPGRSTESLHRFLGDEFGGKISCDGYASYTAYEKEKNGPVCEIHGCWSHVRRYFYEAQKSHPRTAGWALGHIGKLFEWEGRLRDTGAGPPVREALRASHHRMVADRFFKYLGTLQKQDDFTPGSALGKAVTYALNQKEALERTLGDGEVEIHTNLVENALRPLAVGRRNWLFIGHKEAGHKSAVMYSLVRTCHMLGLNPRRYLRDVLEAIPRATNQDVENLTPYNWGVSKNLLKARGSAA